MCTTTNTIPAGAAFSPVIDHDIVLVDTRALALRVVVRRRRSCAFLGLKDKDIKSFVTSVRAVCVFTTHAQKQRGTSKIRDQIQQWRPNDGTSHCRKLIDHLQFQQHND